MDDNNIFGSDDESTPSVPVLDDIEYQSPAPKKQGPQGVTAPVLDDFDDYVPKNTERKGAPTGVSAPVLDDFDDYVPKSTEKKGAPQGVTAPVLDSDDFYTGTASAPDSDESIIAGMTPEQRAMYDKLPPDKQKQVLDMRRRQLSQMKNEPVKAPVLDDEDSYTPPVKEEKKPEQTVTAPILDDEPAPAAYVPKYVDEDLERVKKEAAKKAVSSQLTSNQKDEKESLRMMLALKAEREAEKAKKGFKITIVLAVLGVAAAVFFYLFYSDAMIPYKDGINKIQQIVSDCSLYIAAAAGVSSVLLITGVGGLKSLASFIFLVMSVIQFFPGIVMISQKDGSFGLAAGLYAAAIICSIAVFVTLSASEAVGLFFKKNKNLS